MVLISPQPICINKLIFSGRLPRYANLCHNLTNLVFVMPSLCFSIHLHKPKEIKKGQKMVNFAVLCPSSTWWALVYSLLLEFHRFRALGSHIFLRGQAYTLQHLLFFSSFFFHYIKWIPGWTFVFSKYKLVTIFRPLSDFWFYYQLSVGLVNFVGTFLVHAHVHKFLFCDIFWKSRKEEDLDDNNGVKM